MILRAFGILAVILIACPLWAADPKPVRLIFDTDIMGDVDDVGTVALLHALASRGEVQILAMGVSAKNPWCPLCLDALNGVERPAKLGSNGGAVRRARPGWRLGGLLELRLQHQIPRGSAQPAPAIGLVSPLELPLNFWTKRRQGVPVPFLGKGGGDQMVDVG